MEDVYMREALKQAMIAYDKGDVPVGAVIVMNNKIIARAYNKREQTKDVTNHAEIIAIRKACHLLNDWRLNNCTLYVTLEPCMMCVGAIQQARIPKIVFGAKNVVEAPSIIDNMVGGVLEDECSQILKNFFQDRRNY